MGVLMSGSGLVGIVYSERIVSVDIQKALEILEGLLVQVLTLKNKVLGSDCEESWVFFLQAQKVHVKRVRRGAHRKNP